MGFQSLGTGTGGSLCPQCGTLLTPGLRFCPRCGAAIARSDQPARSVSEEVPLQPLPVATPIPNWIGSEGSPTRPVRVHPVRAPDPGSLRPPATRGRYRAFTLNDVKTGAIDPREGESFQFTGARLAVLICALDRFLTPRGYVRSWPQGDPVQRMFWAQVQKLPASRDQGYVGRSSSSAVPGSTGPKLDDGTRGGGSGSSSAASLPSPRWSRPRSGGSLKARGSFSSSHPP